MGLAQILEQTTPHSEIQISAPLTLDDGELEPLEVALAETDKAYAAALFKARRAADHADQVFRRYLELEDKVRERRRKMARGVELSDGSRVFGIEVVADEER